LSQQFKIILFCDRPSEYESAATIIDHIDSFKKYSKHEIVTWSTLEGLPDEDILSLFDCLIVHYSISLLYERYVSRETLEKIRSFNGLKVLFIQDEYRRVDFACKQINYAGIDMVYTCAPQNVAKKMYARLNERIALRTTLTGFVPEALFEKETKPISKRNIDVGYRARRVPFFLGSKGIEKYLIGKTFLKKANNKNLNCNISSKESDRLYGKAWIDFLSNCKVTLGTESGSSIIDFTGHTEYQLNLYQAFHPFANFDDVPDKFLKSDGELEIQVISPRCFEAAALGTVLVLYPGEYSGILEKEKHYISLEKDFSNINEVIERIKNHDGLQKIADFAREDLIRSGNYSYENFICSFEKDLDQLISEKNIIPKEKILPTSISVNLKNTSTSSIFSLFNLLRSLFHRVWKILPYWVQFICMVTILRKKYFCHFDKDKYSYLNT
jgi:hypothetical protein